MSNEMNQQPRKRGPMGRMGRGMQPGEKPKDLKKSIKQLAQYIGKYKIAIFIVMICAACSTVFNVADSRKSYDRTVRGTDGKDPGHRKH